MIFNKTLIFTSVGIILLLMMYNKSKKSYINQDYKINKNNPSIIDEIIHSEHKYEISDCLTKDFFCNSNRECLEICNKGLPWICKEGTCKLKTDILKPNCIFGTLRQTYDSDSKKIQYECICDLFYYGNDCSKVIHFCDNIKEKKCICNTNSKLFTYYDSLFVCVPQKHYILFNNQDNFRPQ